MGQWGRLKLYKCHPGIIVAFTRHWKKKKYSPLLRARNWYRDCHVIPTKVTKGDFIQCEVCIIGRITYGGYIDTKVRPRFGSKEVDGFSCKKIWLHKNTPMNSWDPSD